ncbi:MAG: PqqD family protein [Halioglobus sp.]|nr:PqqD family protein [Halioglobus sp.]
MNLNQRICLAPQIISQEVAGETVILDIESENYFGLGAVGTRIWQMIQEHGDLHRIYNTLLKEYEVDEMQLLNDLEALLTEASDRGLITLQDTNGNSCV